MKVCPLISQAVILERSDGDIFINPDVTYNKDRKEERGIRFVAKSFKGEVKCIEEICRFYDPEEKVCRFEKLLNAEKDDDGFKEAIESINEELRWNKEQLQKLEELSEEKFNSFTEKLGSLNEKQDGLEQRADENKGKLEELGGS